ncbi:MAG: Nif3-like dinuclear metal center hexameric protein [Planctomycetota bacterium]|nr:Nif3-like dinuclear metal center hexameric protein [Planctomycetota bacterium]
MPNTARQIADTFEKIAPIETGLPGDELGFIYGDPEVEVRGIACMWNAHSKSIQQAIEKGLNMLLVHETLFYHPQQSGWYDGPQKKEDIVANQKRRALLDEHEIVVYRSHSNWDALAVDGVPDQAVKALGIDGLEVVDSQKFFKVHRLPRNFTVADLATLAGRGLDVENVRIYGDRNRIVRQFSFLIGGFGGNQMHMPQAAAEMGAEVIIIGEILEWVVIAALECGLEIIATVHSSSEIPAIRRQAELLAENFPGLPVEYIHSGMLGF